MRAPLQNRRGASLIIVICVMAVMMTLSLTLLSSAGMLVANSQRGYRQEQVRIAATTLSDAVRDELDGALTILDAGTGDPEETMLVDYLGEHVKPLVSTGYWEYYATEADAAADKYSQMHISTMTSLPAGFENGLDSAVLGIYYIADGEYINSSDFSKQCGAVTVVIAATVYGVDGEEYTVKSAYGLTNGTVEYNNRTYRTVTWHAKEMLPQ